MSWRWYRKKSLTTALRIIGPFEVETIHKGNVVCQDGYLAVDSQGYPYSIAKDEFDKIYELWEDENNGTENTK